MGDACFFIGHRPEKLPWGRDTASPDFRRYYERLAETLEHAVASGYREFYTGMTEGVSLWAGEIVADYKAAHPADGVRLLAVRPYEGQGRTAIKRAGGSTGRFWGRRTRSSPCPPPIPGTA